MKKIIFILTVILLCGCSFNSKDEYEGYEHYKFAPSKIFNMGTINDKIYALAHLENGYNTGIFYQISEEDYILLEEIDYCNTEATPEGQEYNYFYENKLYIIRCSRSSIIEYTINDLDIQKRELNFDGTKILDKIPYNGHEHYIGEYSIEKIEEDYIYFIVNISGSLVRDVKVKCSLTDYICDYYE